MATKRPGLSLKGRALALLAQREHSAPELRRKLLRHVRKETAVDAGGAAADADADADAANVANADPDADPSDDAATRVEAVLDWLQAHDYLSETRFVESRVHARASRYGNLRIRQELAQHGLALDADAAQALKDSELDRAVDVWRRKFGAPPADAAERARQSRFLAQRGFSPEVISRVLRRTSQ